MRKLLQEHLDNRSPGQCEQPVKGADGVERPRVRLQERKLETVFGTVSVERTGYGKKGTESLHPLDGELKGPYGCDRCPLEPERCRGHIAASRPTFEQRL